MRRSDTMAQRDTLLILDDQPDITEAIANLLECEGRTIITSSETEVAELVARRVPVTTMISDIRFSTRFAYEGLEVIDTIRKCSPDSRILMISADRTEELEAEARRRGAVAFLEKPFDSAELLRIVGQSESKDGGTDRYSVPSFSEIVESANLIPFFQPIVTLGDESPYGFESLARFRGDIPFLDCDFLFEYALRKGRLPELDLACLRRTLRYGAPLARRAKLFINVHPQVFSDCSRLASTLISEARDSDVPLENVVLEITEQEKLTDVDGAVACIESLRPYGVQFALDDVGAAYSHLDLIDRIKPTYLKVSHHFGGQMHHDSSKRKIVRNIVSLAGEF